MNEDEGRRPRAATRRYLVPRGRDRPGGVRPPLPTLAVVIGCLGGLAWVLAAQHNQLSRAIAEAGHTRPELIAAAVGCEWVSMVTFARVQRRILRAGGQRLPVISAIGIAFASNAVSLSVPVVGSELGTAFTYRQFRRHHASNADTTVALLASGVLSTLSLMAIIAAGALASGNIVAGVLGALWATACVAGTAGLILSFRVRALRRLIERILVAVVRICQRLRHGRGEHPEAVVARMLRQISDLRLRRIDWAVAAGMALLNWAADAACLALSLAASRLALPPHDLLLVWSAGVAAGTVYLTPGGVGTVDVALVAALAGCGVPAAAGIVGVLIYRLISLWLLLLAGWVIFLLISFRGITTTRPPRQAGHAARPPRPWPAARIPLKKHPRDPGRPADWSRSIQK